MVAMAGGDPEDPAADPCVAVIFNDDYFWTK